MDVVAGVPPYVPTPEHKDAPVVSAIPSSLYLPEKIPFVGEEIQGDQISPRDYVNTLNKVNSDLNLDIDDFEEKHLPNCFQFHYLERKLIVNLQHTNALLQQKYDQVCSHLINYRQKNNALEQKMQQKQTFIETETIKQKEISSFLKSKIEQLQKTANYDFHEQAYAVERKQWEARIQELEEQIISLRSDLIRQQIEEQERNEELLKDLDRKLKEGQERERAQVDCYMTLALHFEEEWKRSVAVITTYDKEKLSPVIQERDHLKLQILALEKTIESKNKKLKTNQKEKKRLNTRISILDTKVTLLMEKLGSKELATSGNEMEDSGTSGGDDSDADVKSNAKTEITTLPRKIPTPFREPDVSKKGGLNDHAKITKYEKKLKKKSSTGRKLLVAPTSSEGDLNSAVYNERTNALENLDSGVQTFLPSDMQRKLTTGERRHRPKQSRSLSESQNESRIASPISTKSTSAGSPVSTAGEVKELKKLGIFDRFRKISEKPVVVKDVLPGDEEFNGTMVDTHDELLEYSNKLVEQRNKVSDASPVATLLPVSDADFSEWSDEDVTDPFLRPEEEKTPVSPTTKKQRKGRGKLVKGFTKKPDYEYTHGSPIADPDKLVVVNHIEAGQDSLLGSIASSYEPLTPTPDTGASSHTYRSDDVSSQVSDTEEEVMSPVLEEYRKSFDSSALEQRGLMFRSSMNRSMSHIETPGNETLIDSKLVVPDHLKEEEEQHLSRTEAKIQALLGNGPKVTTNTNSNPTKLVTTMVITSFGGQKEVPVHKKIIVAEPDRNDGITPRSHSSMDFTNKSKPNYFLHDKKSKGLHPEAIIFDRFDKKSRREPAKLPKLGKSPHFM